MIIIIDNYDSFTYNLVQCVGELGYKIKIVRNDERSLKEIELLKPSHIIISPGPGTPQEAGLSLNIISSFANQTPILGVCLGHQSIGHIYGGTIHQMKKPMHGKISKIYHNQKDIFLGVPNPFKAIRYHSLIINNKTIPKTLNITATTKEGLIMGCQHIKYNHVRGIQFHPESLWTEYGKLIIRNFLST